MARSMNTITQSIEGFKEMLCKIVSCTDPVDAIHMINREKTFANGLISVTEKAVARRRRTKAGSYTFGMYKTESHQVESIYWYKRHIEDLDAKKMKLQHSIHAERTKPFASHPPCRCGTSSVLVQVLYRAVNKWLIMRVYKHVIVYANVAKDRQWTSWPSLQIIL